MTKLIVAFRNFAKAPKVVGISLLEFTDTASLIFCLRWSSVCRFSADYEVISCF
jgi:hypothetical protein